MLKLDTRFGMEQPRAAFPCISLSQASSSSPATTALQISATMAQTNTGLKHLSNALATPDQLSNSSSSIDGVPTDLETSIRCAGAQLTQAAGVLLHLSQDIIAQAIVIFTRFWLGVDGGSLRIYSAKVCIYLLRVCLFSSHSELIRMSPPPLST
jgi:hypothetical protein